MPKKKNMWIQNIDIKEGSLRDQLNVPKGRRIPKGVLNNIAEGNVGTHVQYRGKSIAVTPLLKKRAVLARTMSKWRKNK